LARDWQAEAPAFPEFERFYVRDFPRRTQVSKSVVSTDSTTSALLLRLSCSRPGANASG
jgi:hypothetical protein